MKNSENISKNKRIEWIDYSKAIGAMFVICLHIPNADRALDIINSFVLPLFFFLSGLTIKFEGSFISFIKKRICTLVWPSIILCGVVVDIIKIVYAKIVGMPNPVDFKKAALGIVLQMRGSYEFGAWFLICLFSAQIMFWIVYKYIVKKKELSWVISLIFFVIGSGYSLFIHKPLPWSADVAFFAVAFMSLGFYLKEKGWLNRLVQYKYAVVYLLIFILGNTLFIVFSQRMNVFLNDIGNPLTMLMTTLGGIGVVCVVCNIFKKNKLLEFIGQNSLIIYCLQYAPIYILNHILGKKVSVVNFLLYFIIVLVISCLLALLIDKKMRFLVGKRAK